MSTCRRATLAILAILPSALWSAVPTLIPPPTVAPSPPADPPWAIPIEAEPSSGTQEEGEVQVTPFIVRDRYGYKAEMAVAYDQSNGLDGTPDTADDVHEPIDPTVVMRYIPGKNGSVRMPHGVQSGGFYQQGEWPLGQEARDYEFPGQLHVNYSRFLPGSGVSGVIGVPADIPDSFWISDAEVTQQVWNAVWADHDPSQAGLFLASQFLQDPDATTIPRDNPVERVTTDAIDYWLGLLKARLDTHVYNVPERRPLGSTGAPAPSLPTEDQWEYACRAGTATVYAFGYLLEPLSWGLAPLDGERQYRYGPQDGDLDANGNPQPWDSHWGAISRPSIPWPYGDINDIIYKRYAPGSKTAVSDGDVSHSTAYLNDLINNPRIGGSLRGEYEFVLDDPNDEDGDDRSAVDHLIVRPKLYIDITDYFQVEVDDKIEANYDSRHRRRFIEYRHGTHVPVLQRYRKLDEHHYVIDPTVPDSDVYHRFQVTEADFDHGSGTSDYLKTRSYDTVADPDDPAYGMPQVSGGAYVIQAGSEVNQEGVSCPTPNEDFFKRSDAMAQDRLYWVKTPGEGKAPYAVSAPYAGHLYRPPGQAVTDDRSRYAEIEAADFIPIMDRYRKSSGASNPPDLENDGHFELHEEGGYVRTEVGGYVRYQPIGQRFTEARYDPGGYYWGRTMPDDASEEVPDRADVERRLLSEFEWGWGLQRLSGGHGVIMDKDTVSAVPADMGVIRLELEEIWTPGDWVSDSGMTYEITADTYIIVDPEVVVAWSVESVPEIGSIRATVVHEDGGVVQPRLTRYIDEWLEDEYDGDWDDGYEVAPVDEEDYARPNHWGLKHMHGNVAEWTSTSWDGISDRSNTASGPYRVVKGGSWRFGGSYQRSAARDARAAGVVETPILVPEYDLDGSDAIDAGLGGGSAERSEDLVPADEWKEGRNEPLSSAHARHGGLSDLKALGYDDVGFRIIMPIP